MYSPLLFRCIHRYVPAGSYISSLSHSLQMMSLSGQRLFLRSGVKTTFCITFQQNPVTRGVLKDHLNWFVTITQLVGNKWITFSSCSKFCNKYSSANMRVWPNKRSKEKCIFKCNYFAKQIEFIRENASLYKTFFDSKTVSCLMQNSFQTFKS